MDICVIRVFFYALLVVLMKIYVIESKIGAWVRGKVYNGKLNDKALLTILSSINLGIFQYKV
jgi:hypothetical protein